MRQCTEWTVRTDAGKKYWIGVIATSLQRSVGHQWSLAHSSGIHRRITMSWYCKPCNIIYLPVFFLHDLHQCTNFGLKKNRGLPRKTWLLQTKFSLCTKKHWYLHCAFRRGLQTKFTKHNKVKSDRTVQFSASVTCYSHSVDLPEKSKLTVLIWYYERKTFAR